MFSTLFNRPHILTRHRTGLCAEARAHYLKHCSDQGYPHSSLQIKADLYPVAGTPVTQPVLPAVHDPQHQAGDSGAGIPSIHPKPDQPGCHFAGSTAHRTVPL